MALKNKIKTVFVVLMLLGQAAYAERIKDLASVAGVRSNQLVGYGLVVGLDGTGDQTTQTPFTVQSIKSMLAQFGVAVPPNVNPQLKNVAAVSLHADLPAFAKPGQKIDVTVASLGNAKSLRGGSLLMAPLKGEICFHTGVSWFKIRSCLTRWPKDLEMAKKTILGRKKA